MAIFRLDGCAILENPDNLEGGSGEPLSGFYPDEMNEERRRTPE